MKDAVRIGELAGRFGINAKTIRYYESIGLLPAPARTEAGYRLYGRGDADRLAFISKAKQLGLSLQEIASILDLRERNQPPCEHVTELIDEKLAAVDAQLQALQAFRSELLTLRAEAGQSCAGNATVCAIIEQHQHQDRRPSTSARSVRQFSSS